MNEKICIPILENRGDSKALSQDILNRLQKGMIGVLIQSHGLFTWGRSVKEAKRHVELLHHIFEYHYLKYSMMQRSK